MWINIRLWYMLPHISTYQQVTAIILPQTATLSLPQPGQRDGAVGSGPCQPGPLATSSISTSGTIHLKPQDLSRPTSSVRPEQGPQHPFAGPWCLREKQLVGLGEESDALRPVVCPCPCLSTLRLCHCLPPKDYRRAWAFLTCFSFHSRRS